MEVGFWILSPLYTHTHVTLWNVLSQWAKAWKKRMSHCSNGCFSGKKMEGDSGLNTLESLRGRLLAERQASRAAKEEAESLGNKVIFFLFHSLFHDYHCKWKKMALLLCFSECSFFFLSFVCVWQALFNDSILVWWCGEQFVELEKKLREEIKLRDKAQRKLQFLKKKLESFNISFPIGQSEHSYSYEKCENSRGSSSCSSSSTHSEANETKPHSTNPALSENAVHSHNFEEASVLIQKNQKNSDPDQILCKDPNQSSENLRNADARYPIWTFRVVAFDAKIRVF